MFQNVSEILPRAHTEHKEEAAIGSLGNREVVVTRETPCEWLTNKFTGLWSNPPPSSSFGLFQVFRPMQLKQADINFLTNHCIQTLRMPFSDHREAIRNWVIQIYKVHDINLSAHRGGHFMDVEALQDADDLLNPVLLQEIERLFPYSSEAYDLRLQAITEERPLSELVFH